MANYEKIDKKKRQIKEYLRCFATRKKRPNYEALLESVLFVYCRVNSNSNPVDFIRISENKITTKSNIKKVVLTGDRDYLIYFNYNNYRQRTSYVYAKRVIDELGLIVEVE